MTNLKYPILIILLMIMQPNRAETIKVSLSFKTIERLSMPEKQSLSFGSIRLKSGYCKMLISFSNISKGSSLTESSYKTYPHKSSDICNENTKLKAGIFEIRGSKNANITIKIDGFSNSILEYSASGLFVPFGMGEKAQEKL